MAENPTPLDTVTDITATDPLSEVTRAERKALLAACAIGLAISIGGLVPQKIEALGIDVSPSQKVNLLQILAGVIAFFLAGFAIYAWADLKRREAIAAQARSRLRPVMDDAMKQYQAAEEQWKNKTPEETAALFKDERFLKLAALSDHAKLAQRVSRVGTIRVAFDVYIPLVVGCATIFTILATTPNSPISRTMELFFGLGTPAALLVLAWRQRKNLKRWVKVRIHRYRDKHFQKTMEEFKALPEGDPRRAELQVKARRQLERKMEDMKNGIY